MPVVTIEGDFEDEPVIPDLFKACNGVRFYVRSLDFSIASGVYPTGNGALLVLAEDGTPECKLTVNMVDAPTLSTTAFYVKSDTTEMRAGMRQAILDLGIFTASTTATASGYVTRYAEVWQFAECTKHFRTDIHLYAVQCAVCMDEITKAFVEKKTRLQAIEAIERLKNIPKGTFE